MRGTTPRSDPGSARSPTEGDIALIAINQSLAGGLEYRNACDLLGSLISFKFFPGALENFDYQDDILGFFVSMYGLEDDEGEFHLELFDSDGQNPEWGGARSSRNF